MLVVGAGITGIYQLYRAREAGLLRAAARGRWRRGRHLVLEPLPRGAASTPRATPTPTCSRRSCSRSGSGRSSSREQPETERYLNHVVDRFDLRRHIRFDARVTVGGVRRVVSDVDRGARRRHRVPHAFFVAATGVLSVPYFPDVPGRDDFRGESFHTGLWPATPVDFAGKRVAVIGTGSSGVQLIPAIADDVASLTVYQRTANWCTPLNNAPITPDEQAQLRADFEAIRETLNTSPAGFLHPAHDRATFDDSKEERQAFFEKMWNSPGFSKLTSNYTDLLFDRAANAEWCEFIAEKIRGIVDDPETAAKLIPTDHRFAEKRPPFVTGYYETYNNPNVSLVDLKQTPIVRMTERGIETAEGVREFDIVVWATGFDFGTGALMRMGIRGRHGRALDRRLGRRSEDVSRRADRRLPEPLLPGRTARGRRQQPALQRRPSRLHHRHAHLLARPRLRHDRSRPRGRRRVDQHGRHGRVPRAVRREQLLLRNEHPRKAAALPLELRWPPQALQSDRQRSRDRLQVVPTVTVVEPVGRHR